MLVWPNTDAHKQVECILDAGADVDVGVGQSPLWHALRTRRYQVARFMRHCSPRCCLARCLAACGHRLLVERGATLLGHLAHAVDDMDTVHLLLEHGVDVNECDGDALIAAVVIRVRALQQFSCSSALASMTKKNRLTMRRTS